MRWMVLVVVLALFAGEAEAEDLAAVGEWEFVAWQQLARIEARGCVDEETTPLPGFQLRVDAAGKIADVELLLRPPLQVLDAIEPALPTDTDLGCLRNVLLRVELPHPVENASGLLEGRFIRNENGLLLPSPAYALMDPPAHGSRPGGIARASALGKPVAQMAHFRSNTFDKATLNNPPSPAELARRVYVSGLVRTLRMGSAPLTACYEVLERSATDAYAMFKLDFRVTEEGTIQPQQVEYKDVMEDEDGLQSKTDLASGGLAEAGSCLMDAMAAIRVPPPTDPTDTYAATWDFLPLRPPAAAPEGARRDLHVKGAVSMLGALDKKVIDQEVKSRLPWIRSCFSDAQRTDPTLTGKLVVKFVIAKDGSVHSSITKTSTLENLIVEQCIHKQFRGMRFPKPKGGGIVKVSYPFVFVPPNPGG